MTTSAPRASAVVVSEIRRRIVSGELSEGEALPSEAPPDGTVPGLEAHHSRGVESARVGGPDYRAAGRARWSHGANAVSDFRVGQAGIFLQRRRASLSDVHHARDLIESSVAGELARTGSGGRPPGAPQTRRGGCVGRQRPLGVYCRRWFPSGPGRGVRQQDPHALPVADRAGRGSAHRPIYGWSSRRRYGERSSQPSDQSSDFAAAHREWRRRPGTGLLARAPGPVGGALD